MMSDAVYELDNTENAAFEVSSCRGQDDAVFLGPQIGVEIPKVSAAGMDKEGAAVTRRPSAIFDVLTRPDYGRGPWLLNRECSHVRSVGEAHGQVG